MDGLNEKIVEFEKFCKDCVNYDKSATEDPCNECLTVPARLGTHQPEKFIKKEQNN